MALAICLRLHTTITILSQDKQKTLSLYKARDLVQLFIGNVSEIDWSIRSPATFGQNDKLALAKRKQRKSLPEITRSNEGPDCSEGHISPDCYLWRNKIRN